MTSNLLQTTMWKALIITSLFGFGQFASAGGALAGGSVTICNQGTVDVIMAQIDNYGLIGEPPTVSGWHPIKMGNCYTKSRLGVALSVIFLLWVQKPISTLKYLESKIQTSFRINLPVWMFMEATEQPVSIH